MPLGPEARKAIEAIAARYPTRAAALLPALRVVERELGAVTDEGIAAAADLLGLPPARVMGVATFYTHYRRPGDGRHVIHVCCTLPCALRGAVSLFDAFSRTLGIGEGQTTPDGRFTLRKAECLAACDLAPAVAVDDELYGPIDPGALDAFLSRFP
jgi:NADH-quinone oxidoreductase subunit E